jgi:hypothetical protein
METMIHQKSLFRRRHVLVVELFGIYLQDPQITRENQRVGMPNKHSEITAPVKP